MPPRKKPQRASSAVSRRWQLASTEIDIEQLQRITDLIAAAPTAIDGDLQVFRDIAKEVGSSVQPVPMPTVITVGLEHDSDEVIIDRFDEMSLVTRGGPASRIDIERGGVAELNLDLLKPPSASLYAWNYELAAAIEDALDGMLGPAERAGPTPSSSVVVVRPSVGRLERFGAWAQTNRGAAIGLAATLVGAVVGGIGLILYVLD